MCLSKISGIAVADESDCEESVAGTGDSRPPQPTSSSNRRTTKQKKPFLRFITGRRVIRKRKLLEAKNQKYERHAEHTFKQHHSEIKKTMGFKWGSQYQPAIKIVPVVGAPRQNPIFSTVVKNSILFNLSWYVLFGIVLFGILLLELMCLFGFVFCLSWFSWQSFVFVFKWH